MGTLWQDIRYGLRMLARKPGFTAVAVLTLALGIGANSAIFSVVYAVLLKPLPFRNPDQLVQLWETESAQGSFPMTGADYLDWRAQNRTFSDMSAYSYQESFNASGSGEAERVAAVETQSNYFALLGVQPLRGRGFAAGEDQAGQNHVALLSYGFWQRHFGGQASAISGTLQLNGEPYTIVGVMPAWFRIPAPADLWIPIDMTPKKLGPRGEHHLRAIGRIRPGVTVSQARADLVAFSQQLEKQFPDSNHKVHAVVVPLKDQLIGDSREQLWILFGAVGLVLLIACANVANLLLARATDRRREVALRTALGAEHTRLVRQMLTESVLLSVMGAIPGIALAYICVSILTASERVPFPQPNPVALNPVVLGFALLVSVMVGLLFGLAPALQSSQINLTDELKTGSKLGFTASKRGRVLRDILVASEIALSLALLAGAGLLLRTFSNLRAVNVGVNADKILTATILLPQSKYSTADLERVFYGRLVDLLSSSPGIRAAAVATELPLMGGNNGYIQIPGKIDQSMEGPLVEWTSITPDYFHVMGIPLLAGREFTETDLDEDASAMHKLDAADKTGKAEEFRKSIEFPAIINRTMARKFWSEQDAIGKVFLDGDGNKVRIVGVVGDIKQWGLRQAPISQAYFPLTWALSGRGWPMSIAVQSVGRPEDVAGAVRSAVQSLDNSLAVFQVSTMDKVISDSLGGTSDQTMLLGVFAGLALLLAAIGTYGVMSYLVTQRTSEIGIRMALGAERRHVLWMILRQGLALAAVGIGVGLIGTFLSTQLLSSFLFGVEPNDPATLAAVSALMAAVAMLACAIPALRATRVDPLIALRYE